MIAVATPAPRAARTLFASTSSNAPKTAIGLCLGQISPNWYWPLSAGAGLFNMESCMLFKSVLIASFLVVTSSIAAEARPSGTNTAPECNVTMPCDFSFSQVRREKVSRDTRRTHLVMRGAVADAQAAVTQVNVSGTQIVSGRPSGCPRSFCGCGAALHVFGRIVPELNLAANWLRFPRTSPAPGMVAARRGHVFVLEQHLQGDMWMAYDANSGGRSTRIHARSLRGYTVVNPHAT
ncbi:hypothetical protein Q2941_15075 [Bradyrhizobium sp. UFLA05-153]